MVIGVPLVHQNVLNADVAFVAVEIVEVRLDPMIPEVTLPRGNEFTFRTIGRFDRLPAAHLCLGACDLLLQMDLLEVTFEPGLGAVRMSTEIANQFYVLVLEVDVLGEGVAEHVSFATGLALMRPVELIAISSAVRHAFVDHHEGGTGEAFSAEFALEGLLLGVDDHVEAIGEYAPEDLATEFARHHLGMIAILVIASVIECGKFHGALAAFVEDSSGQEFLIDARLGFGVIIESWHHVNRQEFLGEG